MKFICFCYYDAKKFKTLSPAELEALGPACEPYDQQLRATGKVLVQSSLSLPETWKCVRPRSGQPVITDGPLDAADQQVGAFLILEADTMEEATHVASKHATANIGENLGFAVEVIACERFEETPRIRPNPIA